YSTGPTWSNTLWHRLPPSPPRARSSAARGRGRCWPRPSWSRAYAPDSRRRSPGPCIPPGTAMPKSRFLSARSSSACPRSRPRARSPSPGWLREVLLEGLRAQDRQRQVEDPRAGMHLVAWLHGRDAAAGDALIAHAQGRGLGLYAIAPYYLAAGPCRPAAWFRQPDHGRDPRGRRAARPMPGRRRLNPLPLAEISVLRAGPAAAKAPGTAGRSGYWRAG